MIIEEQTTGHAEQADERWFISTKQSGNKLGRSMSKDSSSDK